MATNRKERMSILFTLFIWGLFITVALMIFGAVLQLVMLALVGGGMGIGYVVKKFITALKSEW
jgi:hypothetical protein